MEILDFIIRLKLTLYMFKINSAVADLCNDLQPLAVSKQLSSCAEVSTVDSSVICKLWGTAHLPAFSEDGDYIIGGVFFIHYNMEMVKHNYTTKPEPLRCTGRIEPLDLQFSLAMIFAIEEINNSSKLLPGIRLGYQIHDSCAAVPMAVKVAFQLTNGLDRVFYTGDNCLQSGMVMAVIGDSGSTPSISISRIIGSFNIPQWIGGEGWVTHTDMLKFTFCAGAMGFGIPRSVIPGLRDFLLDLYPTEVAASPILTEFWEDAFNCRLEKSSVTDKRLCDGSEDIKKLESPYTDTSDLRITNMVYKAVYAIAHAIHNAVCQETNSRSQCDKLSRIESKQVLTQLKKVHFSQNGYHVSFDANGDPVAKYELVNWQKSMSGSLEIVTVGYYDASLPVGQEFYINKNLTWMEGRAQGTARLPAFSEDGDYIIGGVFSIHYNMEMVKHNYNTMPEPLKCTGRIEPRELHFSLAMIFAIEEINNSSKLLPGIRLGYQIHDSCASVPMAVKVAFQLTNGLDPVFYTGDSCSQFNMMMAVVGDSGSTASISMSRLGEMRLLMEELSREPSPPRQWIGSEGWVTHPDMLKFTFCAGAIGFGIPRSVIPGLRDFLLDLPPTKVAASPILTEFWEDAFNCRLEKSSVTDKRLCNGSEDIQKLQSPYTDTSELRITNMVYKAVYAIAHAIHNAVCQDTNSTSQCDKLSRIESKQVIQVLQKVNFSQNGYHVSFDANGDPVAKYDLVNWQKSMSGSLEIITVGYYDASLPVGQEFHINKEISWMEGRKQGTARLPAFSEYGDYIIGGVFSIHYNMEMVTHKYITKPESLRCTGRIELRELQFSRAMIFAIEEINNSSNLLPGIRLGYQIHDGCSSVPMAVKVAFQLTNSLDPVFYTGNNCSQSSMVMAVVGDSASTPSISISRIIGSTAVVVVAFAGLGEMRLLLEVMSREPSPLRQWIGSEAWVTHPDMLKFTFCAGAIGFGIPRSVIPGLRDFLLDLSPTKVASSPILTEFWEDAFNCSLEKTAVRDKRLCNGSEDIQKLQSPYTDTSELRITNMVYKAVYAIAHAIHNAVCQETNSTSQCDKLSRIESKQVLTHLKKVNFFQNGYHVSFDANGDPVAKYELVNWQKSTSGSPEIVTVGYYDASLPVGQEFHINKNLTWMEGRTQTIYF
ncbi:Extracellular calcium-sensing receptor [Channa argus]|uniref:Extracellular calcium-sensing receptor n=1 Tax=Channa argus TaxID=215402 RepID=A0A6G1PR69_CHAAH|nr:Extracellular calcium-sensing receptor [Channa argus]